MNGDFRIGSWLVQPSLNSVSQNGTSIRIESKVMDVLVCLAVQAGDVVSKERLLQTVWPDTFVTDDVLKRSISELRRVFKDDAQDAQIIETIPKRGYRLLSPVESVMSPAAKNASSALEVVSVETAGPGPTGSWKLIATCTSVAVLILTTVFIVNWSNVQRWLGARAPAIRSIAVLPLQNLSDDPKQEYFAEGVTDALITDLAQVSALRIVSRTTIMGYGRANKPLPQIARELNVDGIIEGTVQRSGDRVRITAQLIYGPSDRHLWASTFERQLKDVLELESAVAAEIASEIQVKVTPTEQAKFRTVRQVNPNALDAYLEARFHLDEARKVEYYKGKRQQELIQLRKAVSYLDTAIQDDPQYIPADVAYFDTVESFHSENLEYLPKAKAALTQALELDPTNVPAHIALARLLMQFEYDWVGAESEYTRAIELNPNSAEAHFQYSEYFGNVGRNKEADEQRNLAQALDPATDYAWRCCDSAHIIRVGMSLDEEAAAIDQKAPDDPFLQGLVAKDYGVQRRYKESLEHWERCLTIYGWDIFVSLLKRANAKAGSRFALEEWMRAAEQYSRAHDDWSVVPMAFTYSSLGDKDRAFAWLDKAVEQRSWIILHLKDDEVWDPLRSDPRFTKLLKRVGLSPQ